MTAPVRERLLAAILTATGGVYGVPAPQDERDMPMTLVVDGTDTATENYDYTQWSMPITLGRAELALDATGNRNALRAQAHDALAALITAMYADPTFGGLAVGVDTTGGGIQLEAGKFVFAEANFIVRYQHLRGQPAVLTD